MAPKRTTIALIALLLPLAGCEQKSAPIPKMVEQVASPQPASPGKATSSNQHAAFNASASDISAGRAKYSSFCAGCHGPKAEGISYYPKLAGQGAAVIETKLAVFRGGQMIGPKSGNMIPIARMLTETEVKQVAAYLGSL